jgi:hypothetical protein
MQRQKNPRLAFSVAKQRHLELKRLGLTKEQAAKVAGTDRLVADGYLEIAHDSEDQPIYCDGEPVYILSEKGRQLWAQRPPQPQE